MQIIATGVCHTDLYHLFEGKHKDGFPVVLDMRALALWRVLDPGSLNFNQVWKL